jgi:hypothetical protein
LASTQLSSATPKSSSITSGLQSPDRLIASKIGFSQAERQLVISKASGCFLANAENAFRTMSWPFLHSQFAAAENDKPVVEVPFLLDAEKIGVDTLDHPL